METGFRMSLSTVVLLAALAAVLAGFGLLGANWATNRASRSGAYGTSIGTWLGVTTRRGDPFGITARLPATGAQRTPVSTGTYGEIGWLAVVEEGTPAGTTVVCYLGIHAGLDADIIRRADGATERTHATRGELADRLVRAIGASVPQARLVWTVAGSAPPPTRDQFDRASASLRPVGLSGDGPVGAVGLGLRADLVTNPVAWLRWLREVVYAEQDGLDAPAPPSVGFS